MKELSRWGDVEARSPSGMGRVGSAAILDVLRGESDRL